MLGFFRKFERTFYILITAVIIISFSFFGTYGTLTDRTYQDEKAFTAVDGTPVNRSEIERMALFIGTDASDMQQYGSWGPNFFNDGVIDNDLIQTGLAKLLMQQYHDQIKADLDSRSTREKRYKPYEHPAFKALSATEVWRRYNPKKMEYFTSLLAVKEPTSAEGIEARINLYEAERQFSGQDLKQAILFAEKMNQNWVRPDPNLPYADLSLFGYHTADDWFGPKFIRIASAFIINAAKEAEAKGYKVTNDEVLADLIKNARTSYSKVAASGKLGVSNANDYFREQLRRMHMDQNQAIHTWKQVMLFRRMYGDIGNSIVTDALPAQEFLTYAKQSVKGDEYTLPESLQIGNFKELQSFETYLKAVAPKSEDLVSLPNTFKAIKDVPQELVEQRYQIEIAQVDTQQLATKIGVRATWNWELEHDNWSKMVAAFPELGVSDSKTQELRERALDRLDSQTRARIDAFAREEIVKENPASIEEALAQAPVTTKIISWRAAGGNAPLAGVTDRTAFQTFLATAEESAKTYSPDQRIYYSIKVIAKDSEPHIMTYEQAKKENILEPMATKELNDYYVKVREASPKDYQLLDGEWKELDYIRSDLARRFYSKTLAAVQKQAVELQAKEQQPKEWTPDLTAAVRLIKHVNDAKTALQIDPADTQWVAEDSLAEDGLLTPMPLADQWKLRKKSFNMDRSEGAANLDSEAGTWSALLTAPNGLISFRHITETGAVPPESLVTHDTFAAHKLLANGAQQSYTKTLLAKLQEKKAMPEDYLQPIGK